MKQFALIFVVVILFATRLFADFTEAFTGSPVGKTITKTARLILDPGEKSGFSVLVFTDAGHRFLPAKVSTNLDVQYFIGKDVKLTATKLEDGALMIVGFQKLEAETNQFSKTAALVSVEASAPSLLEVIKKCPDNIKAVYLTDKVSSVELKNGIALYAKSTDRQRDMFDDGMKAKIDIFWGR